MTLCDNALHHSFKFWLFCASQGTMTHMAPEIMIQGHISKAADVYALGMVLWGEWQPQHHHHHVQLQLQAAAPYNPPVHHCNTWGIMASAQLAQFLALCCHVHALKRQLHRLMLANALLQTELAAACGCLISMLSLLARHNQGTHPQLLLFSTCCTPFQPPSTPAELYTAKHVFRGIPRALLGHQITLLHKRPEFPADTHEEYVKATQQCWDPSPAKR
jgi:hypothetical protein